MEREESEMWQSVSSFSQIPFCYYFVLFILAFSGCCTKTHDQSVQIRLIEPLLFLWSTVGRINQKKWEDQLPCAINFSSATCSDPTFSFFLFSDQLTPSYQNILSPPLLVLSTHFHSTRFFLHSSLSFSSSRFSLCLLTRKVLSVCVCVPVYLFTRW